MTMSNFIVLRRTESEIEVFGGDVYIDIDGKNAGIVKEQDISFDLPVGRHTIKMYKSHTMGTFIGVAETDIDIVEGEKLYARYSAPLMVNQPGNILVAPFTSESELDKIVNDIERNVHTDYTEQKIKTENMRKESEKNDTSLFIWIFVVPMVFGFLYWIISMSYYW